ncbi:hypothetical protein SCP_0801510 [Sparassis crispa]|uniref:Uncharacterized protein n=1 Tax=Sparassis crispa TaxID=139825 RepID=A0A401GTT0_9APHY|nr:hypothetical protein SCP_0801510 [Sparassis crispa]GBE85632.1 hypothetical protein SCP_0801510 [Sparassis crispa]
MADVNPSVNPAFNPDTALLGRLRSDPSSWEELVSFSPIDSSDAESDSNLSNRMQAMLALHADHFHCPDPELGPPREDEALVAYLLSQEIRLHQHFDGMRPALNLACFLMARYRKPAYVWAVWAAKNSGPYDVFVCVDILYLYYTAGGVNAARKYVEACTLEDVLEGAQQGGAWEGWWSHTVDAHGGDVAEAFRVEQTSLLQRIDRDRRTLSDEHVVRFISSPLRTDTKKWAALLL